VSYVQPDKVKKVVRERRAFLHNGAWARLSILHRIIVKPSQRERERERESKARVRGWESSDKVPPPTSFLLGLFPFYLSVIGAIDAIRKEKARSRGDRRYGITSPCGALVHAFICGLNARDSRGRRRKFINGGQVLAGASPR
jgi:hypothetical protein